MATMEVTLATNPSRRRWFQYRLRMLFVVMTSTAIICGVLRTAWERAEKERNAAEELRKLGASTDDWPGWQEIVFGHNYAPVVEVDIYTVQQLGAASGFLKDLPHLEHLDLSGTQATDHDVKSLRDLSVILSLDLSGTRITDAGLKDISQLRRLQFLTITGTGVTEHGAEELARTLPNCKITK
jgi:hypothetical protein